VKVARGLASRQIEHFSSSGFAHTRVARGDVQVSFATLDGRIGGHPAASRQLLVVLQGRVEVAGGDERAELGVRDAVEWQEGEWHQTRSLVPSILLLVEGAFE
jgi:mannose-6-phosphate isomerase-like protein (cupin superfamily)